MKSLSLQRVRSSIVLAVLAISPWLHAWGQAMPRPTLARPNWSAHAALPWASEQLLTRGVPSAPLSATDVDSSAVGRHRIPLVAGVLGIIPGLGHLFAGEPRRGAAVFAVWFGSGMVAFNSTNKVTSGVSGTVLLGSSVFGMADGALAARRFNRRHAARPSTASVLPRTNNDRRN